MSLATLFRRLRGSVRSSAFEAEMEAELRHHLELETDALVARGLSPAAARDTARQRFGSVALVKDDCRDSWGMRALDTLAQDLRDALRNLRAHPAYTSVVLLTLALGIGANTAIFSAVHAVLLSALPYAHGGRLVDVRQQQLPAGIERIGFSAKEMDDYRRQTPSLDALVEYHQMGFNLLGSGEPTRVQTGVVSHNFFDVIGVSPILGRAFTANDDRRDAPAVLILSYAYWKRTLGGDPHVVGRVFEMNDRVHTVVGVLPNVPLYPEDNDVYMPVSACPFRSAPATVADRGARMVSAVGRLRPGASLERVRGELALVADGMVAAHPKDYVGAAGFTATARPVKDELTRRARPTLLVLIATTGFVLLLVCANVANLMLARVTGRERELAVRAALGAGRRRIARQLLTESAVLSLAGGALGVAVAWLSRDLIVAFTARFSPRAAEIGIDGTVLLFALTVSIVTGVLFGIAPAYAPRREIAGSLKDARRTAALVRGVGPRQALIVAQVAIAFVLLIAAGLMVKSFIRLQQVDAGFSTDHVLTMRVNLDFVKYDTAARRHAFFEPLLARVSAAPGVRSAALSLAFPLDESLPSWFTTDFAIEGRTVADSRQPLPQASYRLASPGYFQTIGMTLLRGRAFAAADAAEAVGIVNLSMARHHFGALNPVGRRVSFDHGAHWITIVGVVNDVKQFGLATPPADEVYLPFARSGAMNATLLVRTPGEPMAAVNVVQAIAHGIDPKQPLSHAQTLDDVRTDALASPRLTAMLVTLFAVLALLITAAGIAGVVSCSVSRRTVEIGVRMALGASPASVVLMVVRQGLAPVTLGFGIGIAGALVLTQVLGRLLFAVEPTDPPTYAAVAAVLALAAACACLAPARRAAAIDPMCALKAE